MSAVNPNMLTREKVEAFWKSRLDFEGDPCHFMDYWMDKYTFESRVKALKQVECFKHSKLTTDIGCGVGSYTKTMWYFHNEENYPKIIGYDRVEFIEKAAISFNFSYDAWPGLYFHQGLIPDPGMRNSILNSDVVALLTVYDFLAWDDRQTLLSYLEKMKRGSHVVLLDMFKANVPDYQKHLSYKDVEPIGLKLSRFYRRGFKVVQSIPVNKVDTRIFHRFGKNEFAYNLTKFLDKMPFIKDTYKVVVFEKIA